MKRKRIEIELLSDTCVSDGGIYNSAVDTEICQDDFGFPYIPGKRMRGCLRECALELNDWGAGIEIGRLFGQPGNQRGQAIIKSAYIKDRPLLMEAIHQLEGTPLCHVQNVLNCYSYVRTQTAMEDGSGIADDQSLRTIRVANKGLVLEAEVVFLSEDAKLEEDFKKCLAVFRHIGIARTRGLGEIKARLLEGSGAGGEEGSQGQAESTEIGMHAPYQEGSTYLEYEIYLDEPVVCKSVGEQEASSMDYLEGAKILGLISQRLRESGKSGTFQDWLERGALHCSNAYLAVDGKRLHEIPAAIFDIKNDKENYRNKVYLDKKLQEGEGEPPACDHGLQLNRAKHRYVWMAEDGRMARYSVEMESRYHHSRPKDKSIGHVQEGADGSQLYQISSIKEGQAFRGFIEGGCEEIKQIYSLLAGDAHCFLGYGGNGEYGSCTIRVTGLGKAGAQSMEVETADFYVLLKSSAIIYNDKAMYSTDARDLQEEILSQVMPDALVKYQECKEAVGEEDSNRRELGGGGCQRWKEMAAEEYQKWRELAVRAKVEKYMDILAVGGYNVTWGCRKPTIYAFDKGTVLVFHMPEGSPVKIKMGRLWIGERCAEGFGEIMVCPLDASGSYQGKALCQIPGCEGKGEMEGQESPSEGQDSMREKIESQEALSKSQDSKQNQPGDRRDISKLWENAFVKKICTRRLEEFLRFQASIQAEKVLEEVGLSFWGSMQQRQDEACMAAYSAVKPTISNMLLMCKEEDSVDNVLASCQKRFDKGGDKKDRKLKCAEKIIRHVKGKQDADGGGASRLTALLGEFEEKYRVTGVAKTDGFQKSKWEMRYLGELLVQMKYAIRQAERKGCGRDEE